MVTVEVVRKPGYATLEVTAIANPEDKDIRLVLWGPLATDIWSDGTTVWAANVGGVNVGGVVAAYALEGGLPDTGKDLSSTLSAAGNEAPTGIWSDGTTVWLADYYGQKVYAYRLSDGARLRDKEFSLLDASQAVSPVGIWSDGETLLVNSWSEGKVYAFRLSDGERSIFQYEMSLKAGRDSNMK